MIIGDTPIMKLKNKHVLFRSLAGLIIRIFGFVTLLKLSLPLADFFRYREIRYRLTVLVTVNSLPENGYRKFVTVLKPKFVTVVTVKSFWLP